jgi:protease-4
MFQAVRRLGAEKPVICSMGDVAASGGYYVAAACDKIYANGSTLTGSIGVISQFVNYGELFRKVGLDETTVKSGRFKDAGNPTRPLTPAERALFQQMIGDVYQQFTADVLVGRQKPTGGKLTRQKLLALADGRVYTGRQAKASLLVDENGGLYDAIQEAGKLGKLPGKPNVRNLSSGGGLGSLLGASSRGSLDSIGQTLGQAFARGAVSQIKSESTNVPGPLAR